jgi:hypothetical protein
MFKNGMQFNRDQAAARQTARAAEMRATAALLQEERLAGKQDRGEEYEAEVRHELAKLPKTEESLGLLGGRPLQRR